MVYCINTSIVTDRQNVLECSSVGQTCLIDQIAAVCLLDSARYLGDGLTPLLQFSFSQWLRMLLDMRKVELLENWRLK